MIEIPIVVLFLMTSKHKDLAKEEVTGPKGRPEEVKEIISPNGPPAPVEYFDLD